jgi:phosphate transport system substrate-binding protein
LKAQRFMTLVATCGALAFGVAACGGDDDGPESAGSNGESAESQDLSGQIRIDGSSTVQPVAEAASELFQEEAPNIRITVGGIGTGDGFARFCRGELTIADASRAIEDDEIEACEMGGIEPVQVQVGIDGLSVVANQDLEIPEDCITTEQLTELLAPNSEITNYSELGAGFPDQEVAFFTPGTESGTYDYFTEEVLDTDAEQRTEGVQTSADDNQIVTGISGTRGALGYVGFAFAEASADQLKVIAVDSGEGCVEPSIEMIADGSYTPLSRPLFMYPSTETIQQPEVQAFIQFILDNNERVNEAAGYIPLTDELIEESSAALEAGEGNVG